VGTGQGRLLIPSRYLAAPETTEIPEGTSSYGAYFTTGRVFPSAALTNFPYSAAGKLFFHDPRTGGNFVCSASVLRLRVIVMAGHCVAHPSTSAASRYFYNNFLFVPAYNNGAAPFKSWGWSRVFTTNTWYLSSGSIPNAQDVGMINPPDQKFGTVTKKIGQVTGFLGYLTNSLAKNNVTMLGYPTNLDNGQSMEINNAQTFAFGGNNTYIYGSAMRGGSSGGPWIQDFGIRPTGTPPNTPPVVLGNNFLVAVTSYGPIATTPAYQGASNLNADFLSLLSSACAPTGSGNC
jgi:V8-like Glu-specific endopeptidase